MIMTAKDQWLRTSLVTIVVIHFIIVLWHGAAHAEIPVQLSSAQTAFVIIVITLLPVIGGGLLWSEAENRCGLADRTFDACRARIRSHQPFHA